MIEQFLLVLKHFTDSVLHLIDVKLAQKGDVTCGLSLAASRVSVSAFKHTQ